MSLNTLPNYPRGVLILDPAYYTSSVFVEPMRKDIQGLLEDFVLVYSSSPPPRRVFSIFKDVWSSRGWEFLHLCAIDDVVRDTFLITVFRLFLERLNETEATLMRVGALFGLYTTFLSQPTSHCRVQHQIPIPIDVYASFTAIFTPIPTDVSLYVTHVLSKLMSQRAFLILPHSTTTPYNPCKLPHAVLQAADPSKKGKVGRKTKRDKELIALSNLRSLESLVAGGNQLPDDDGEDNEEELYIKAKEELLATVPAELVREAEKVTSQRLHDIDASVQDVMERTGVHRVETEMASGQGLLHLLHGTKKQFDESISLT